MASSAHPSLAQNAEAGPSSPRPGIGVGVGVGVGAGAGATLPPPISPRNPQLGPDPWLAYPTPTPEEVEDELPPYMEEDNVPLGPMLSRATRRWYADMRHLVEATLPPLQSRQKPRHIIEYAKNTRHAALKHLAVLRWKQNVDLAIMAAPDSDSDHPTIATSFPPSHALPSIPPAGAASFPTPLTNGDSNDSPASYVGKGKGRMSGDDPGALMPPGLGLTGEPRVVRGKVTDAKRITQLMEHQNRQHEEAVGHLKYAAGMVERLRERNADILTAVSLLQAGTYTRFPSALTESFEPRETLTNAIVLDTLQRLNAHIRYRLRCVDYLPPEISVDRVEDGKAYISGGGEHGWKAQMTVWGVGGDGQETRWWLTGVEWAWRIRGVDDPGGAAIRPFSDEERQQILDVVNAEVLPPRVVDEEKKDDDSAEAKVDAPLVRLYNFIQHLSLSYQLEVLFGQAMLLGQGERRKQLSVDIDRQKKALKLSYWVRARPPPNPATAKRPASGAAVASKGAYLGGTITVGLTEAGPMADDEIQSLVGLSGIAKIRPTERVLPLQLTVKWEARDGGAVAGIKAGEAMDAEALRLDPARLDITDMVDTATRSHASLRTRDIIAPVLTSTRFANAIPPVAVEDDEHGRSARPTSLHVPIPTQTRSEIRIGVSAITGLLELEDTGAKPGTDRADRAQTIANAFNDGRTRLVEDISRLLTAIVVETVEGQMRQLGWQPTRRLPLRPQEMAKTDLSSFTTVFVPLPSSPLHYLAARATTERVVFELIRLARVPAENGIGTKLTIGERSPLDVPRLKARRTSRTAPPAPEQHQVSAPQALLAPPVADAIIELETSGFQISNRDLKDVYIFANALVAQTIVEQQLKDRAIPYATQYPASSGDNAPTSRSTVAGMIPIFSVQSSDLLKEGPAAEVAMPKVFMQIKDWWKGGKCQVVTIVQLRHRSSMASVGASPGLAAAAANVAAKSDGIIFDQASSVVRFVAEDITRCVASFTEQWERLSKVIVVAGDVTRLTKEACFRDLKMLSFDLRTATFAYAAGFVSAITYDPSADCYQASFLRATGTSSTPAAAANLAAATPRSSLGDGNPHEPMAPLLAHHLNALVTERHAHASTANSTSVGRRFIALLKATLPFLLEADNLRQTGDVQLVVSSVTDYRLVWDSVSTRYAVDVSLVLDHQRYLITDGSASDDLSCGLISRIPGKGIEGVLLTVERIMAHAKKISGQSDPARGKRPKMLKLDSGRSILCDVELIAEVVRLIVGEVDGMLRGR